MRRRRFLAAVLCVAAFPLLAVADDRPGAALALAAAEEPLVDQDWARAATALAKVRADWPGTPQAEEAAVLEARALFLAKRPREALDVATAFAKEHGGSPWEGRMQATVADAYGALEARGEEAAALRARAEFLTGPEQRGRVAALYVRLADEDFDGKDGVDAVGRPTKTRDVPRALAAYSKAVEIGVAPADRARVLARRAQALEETGQWAAAEAAWDALVKEGEGASPVAAPDGAERETRLVGRAHARLREGKADEARKDLRGALATWPKGARRLEVLRLLAEERFHAAARGGPDGDLAFDEGVALLRQAVEENRDAPEVPAILKSLAEALQARGRFAEAATEWRGLVERFRSDPAAPAWRHALAEALAAAGRFDEAVAEWKTFLSAYPEHPLWQTVQQRIPQARFQKGAAKRDEGDVEGAIAAWRAFAEEHATDPRAPEALVEVGVLLRGKKDFDGAVAVWRGVAGRYAGSPQAPRARLLTAQTLEDDLGKLEDAITEYEALIPAHGATPEAAEAQGRLARLRGKHLEVRTDRVVPASGPATLRVVTRNLPSLSVRVYRLGLEDYFRRKQTVLGVENVQFEIVKPDATAEWKLDPYAPYRLTSAERPVPVTGPGAYVVVAGDDDLTSTTLLLVSDVETVVKASAGRQVFVWARNRATGAPVEGARVLVSDGTSVFLEGVTGKDGVFVQDTTKTARRVLVLAGEQAAASEVEPGDVFAEGRQTKVYVHTDRPAYRPGQKVQWRAIFRRADGGEYRTPAGAKAVAVLLDPRGQEVERKDVVASQAGTFDGDFAVDGEAPLGVWSVRVDVDDRSFAGSFAVLEYRKPEFTVAVVPEKPSYATGQSVAATVRLTYAFGGPVAQAPVTWEVVRVPRDFTPSAVDDYSWYFQDADALERARKAARTAPRGTLVARGESVTDERGETRIEFATADRDEDAEYVVTASAIDVTRRFVVDEGRIPVVRRDHWAVVSTDRRVYRPKQEVHAAFQTVDANQSPVSREGEALLVRVKRVAVPAVVRRGEDKSGFVELREEEVEVATQALRTDEKGRAEAKFTVPGPGTFRVRWKSVDARKAVVTAAATFDVSGEAEDLAKDARLVAAKRRFVEGDKAEVLLQSPVVGVQALLTFEGEKVLSHRLVDVREKSAVLEIPIEPLYAPNVTLKVAVPAGDRLLEAEDEVVVLRFLDVAVKPSKATAAPGEDVEFTVTTRDAAGKPVPAEVGLAVVDESLFGVAPDRAPAIRPFFYDKKRVNRVATASSVGFKTYGVTRETNKELLANAAAQGGDADRVFAQSALRLARQATEHGDWKTAVAQAMRASAADPSSWDARALLVELASKEEAKEFLKQETGDTARLQAEAAEERKVVSAQRNAFARRGDAEKDKKPGESADHDEATEESFGEGGVAAVAPPSAPTPAIGLGGSAGGTFKGRGGHRNLRAAGGGKAGPGSPADSGVFYNDALDGTTAGRAENMFQVPLADAAQLGAQMGYADAPPIAPSLRKAFADTAAWEPHVTTDASGTATVKVKLPDNLTRWRATARGVGGDSLFGEGSGSLVAKRDVLVRLDAPRFLTQGDEAVVPTAIHNGADAETTVQVKVRAEGAKLSGEDATVVVPARGRALHDRTVSAATPGAVRLEAQAVGAQGGDRSEASFGTIARGVRATDGRSGALSTSGGGTTQTFVEVPAKAVPGATRLTVVLYPGLDAAILDALLYLDLFPYGCVEQTVDRFLPAAWAREALTKSGSPDASALSRLDRAVAASVARLKNLANADGSFGWFRGGKGDAAMTALAVLGLREADRMGVAGAREALDRSAAALRGLVRAAPDDVQALCHWALASAGAFDEEAYAVTFRRRNEELSVPGLAWLCLAALEAQRSFDSDDLVGLLLARRREEGTTTSWPGREKDGFAAGERLATALAVRALVEAGTASDAAERGMRRLLGERPDAGFGTTMETAAFVGAASAWLSHARPQGFGGTVTVSLDGAAVKTVTIRAGGGVDPKDRRFVIGGDLGPGRHTLSFALAGQGEVRWAARLDAVEASDDLPAEEHGMKVERLWLDPVVVAVEGAELPVKPGYEVLRPAARPHVDAKSRERAATGERVLVRLTLTAPRDLDYVMVEDPLPAGFEVLSDTAAGPFDHEERRDDRQVFFLSHVKTGSVALSYVIQAVHLGAFTALGTRASAMYLPEAWARAEGRRISVTATRGGAGASETGPTPDELFEQGKRLLEAKRWAEGARVLAGLRDANPLRDEVVVEIEALLLKAAIETKDAKEIVRARESLVRRDAARVPTDLDSARAIAAAYVETGAPAVASPLYRDLVARAFGFEAGWAETLRARGSELEGLDEMGKALARYPVSNAAAQAAFARATRYRELRRPAGAARAGAPMDEEALAALRAVGAHYAETYVAAPAAYARIETMRRMRDLDGAVAEASAFPKRFPDSPYVDDAWYFLMDGRLQKFEAAPSPETAKPVLEAARVLGNEKFKRPDGREDLSEFRPRAFHATARVRHVLGDLDAAIEAYREAAGQVEDAREALAYLTETRLTAPEAATAPPAGSAKLAVRYRNVGEIRFRAYPVDLQTLFAIRRTLEGLNRIDLSGVTPAAAWSVTPPGGADHAWHDLDVELPLGRDAAGVFLVVAKAGDLETGTVVLKTDLSVALQSVGEKVRVHVTDASGRGVRGAYVTVSDGTTIKARGRTDGRGTFEAPGVGPKAFVVASEGDRYAVAR